MPAAIIHALAEEPIVLIVGLFSQQLKNKILMNMIIFEYDDFS